MEQSSQSKLYLVEITKKVIVATACITKKFEIEAWQLVVDLSKLRCEFHDGSMVAVLMASETWFVFEHA